jgi:hypothetical protein
VSALHAQNARQVLSLFAILMKFVTPSRHRSNGARGKVSIFLRLSSTIKKTHALFRWTYTKWFEFACGCNYRYRIFTHENAYISYKMQNKLILKPFNSYSYTGIFLLNSWGSTTRLLPQDPCFVGGCGTVTVGPGALHQWSRLPALATKPGHPCASTSFVATLVQE